jgi:DNA-binding MarR family transcriptional regulator
MNSKETQSVLDSIRRIVRGLRMSSAAAERRRGASAAQIYVLQKLSESEGGLSLNELAAATHTHQSSVSVVVTKLVQRRLVDRRRARDDGRRVAITITAKGRALVRRAPEPIQERLIEAIGRLPAGERTALAHGLDHVVRKAGLGDGPAPLFFEEKTK